MITPRGGDSSHKKWSSQLAYGFSQRPLLCGLLRVHDLTLPWCHYCGVNGFSQRPLLCGLLRVHDLTLPWCHYCGVDLLTVFTWGVTPLGWRSLCHYPIPVTSMSTHCSLWRRWGQIFCCHVCRLHGPQPSVRYVPRPHYQWLVPCMGRPHHVTCPIHGPPRYLKFSYSFNFDMFVDMDMGSFDITRWLNPCVMWWHPRHHGS